MSHLFFPGTGSERRQESDRTIPSCVELRCRTIGRAVKCAAVDGSTQLSFKLVKLNENSGNIEIDAKLIQLVLWIGGQGRKRGRGMSANRIALD